MLFALLKKLQFKLNFERLEKVRSGNLCKLVAYLLKLRILTLRQVFSMLWFMKKKKRKLYLIALKQYQSTVLLCFLFLNCGLTKLYLKGLEWCFLLSKICLEKLSPPHYT